MNFHQALNEKLFGIKDKKEYLLKHPDKLEKVLNIEKYKKMKKKKEIKNAKWMDKYLKNKKEF